MHEAQHEANAYLILSCTSALQPKPLVLANMLVPAPACEDTSQLMWGLQERSSQTLDKE